MKPFAPCRIHRPVNEADSFNAAISENPNNQPAAASSARHKRSVGSWQKFWGNGRVLNISFMAPVAADLKARVERLVRQWEPATNLSFNFDDKSAGDIRIFLGGDLNSSYLGTDALLAPLDAPTLNIAVEPDEPEFDLTVLHEFGHALGLQHEHLHPKANIPWDVEKLYDYYALHFAWSTEDVDYNILTPLSDDLLMGPYDKDSIMHYEVPNELTTVDWQVGVNSRISKLDRRNIRKAYPKP